MPEAWDIQTDASNVRVGVIDSGVQLLDELYYNLKLHINPDLSKSFVSGDDDPFTDTYEPDGHGTKVASIIAATSDNATGMAGICWDVQLVSLKIDAQTDEFIAALDYAAENDIFVINYSVGNVKVFDPDERDAIARFPGLVVCCAGNYSTDNDLTSLNRSQHKVYCACGYSTTESHTFITDTNLGVSSCTKCSERIELWNVKEEHELQ